jgi:UDP-N-acetylmuramyl pentapeptide synthase
VARRPKNEHAIARQIAMLKRAEHTGSVLRAAGELGDKNEKLVDETARYAERVATELMKSGEYTTYNAACAAAAQRLEAQRGAA